MQDEQEKVDAALRRMAIHSGGTRELVERWMRRAGVFRAATLEWNVGPSRPDGATSWTAEHGGHHFRIDATQDVGRLYFCSAELGERPLGDGTVEALRARARDLVRLGGPFGGLPSGPATAAPRIEFMPQSRGSGARGETRLEMLQLGLSLLLHIRPEGALAFRLITHSAQAQAEASRMVEADPITLAIHGTRVPWQFADCLPLFGFVQAPPYELLLCALGIDELGILALSGGVIVAARRVTPGQLADFDVGALVDALADARAPNESSAEASSTAAPEPPPAVINAPAEAATTTRRKRKASGRPLDDLIARHFAHVAAQIPANIVGATTARIVWSAIQQAHRQDLPAVSGRGVELFAALHAAGLLKQLPGDHAGRAALQILTKHSPIVRRVHHRRWSLMLPELRQEKSDVIRAIRDREDAP
jgi:hypothetical protein